MTPATPLKQLLRRRRSPDGRRRRTLLIGTTAVGITVAATVAAKLWRTLAGPTGPSRIGDLAALTAESVMNAAQAHLIDAVEHAHEPDVAFITMAAEQGVREAAASGADITAAAIGVVRGALQASRHAGLRPGVASDAARRGAMAVAASIGPAAEHRVREAMVGV